MNGTNTSNNLVKMPRKNTREMIGGCCVCSDESGWAENPLVYCDGQGCNVAVHQGKKRISFEGSYKQFVVTAFFGCHVYFLQKIRVLATYVFKEPSSALFEGKLSKLMV